MGMNLIKKVIAQIQIMMYIKMFTIKKNMQQIHFKKTLQSLKFVSVLHMHYSCNHLLLCFLIPEVHIQARVRKEFSDLGTGKNRGIIVLMGRRILLLFYPSTLTDRTFQ